MKFLILLASKDHFDRWDAADDQQRVESFADYRAFREAVQREGELITGDALQRPTTARTIKPGPDRLVSEGPYTETVEQLGGFYLIDVPTLAQAVDLATLLPRDLTVEVRPTLGIQV